jgi:GxxExxY protein
MNREGRKGSQRENELSRIVLDAAFQVHSALGPGLLESAYEKCLAYELGKQGISTASQVELPIIYDSKRIDAGYRIDMLVENLVIIELKAVERLLPIHEAQLLSYLRLAKKRLGLLINFNTCHLKDGIKRMVNDF